MKNFLVIFCILGIATGSAYATGNRIVECRLVTPKTVQCMPYTLKLLYTQEVSYENRKKIIASKKLSTPIAERVKVITVDEFIEHNLVVYEMPRYDSNKSGSVAEQLELEVQALKQAQADQLEKEAQVVKKAQDERRLQEAQAKKEELVKQKEELVKQKVALIKKAEAKAKKKRKIAEEEQNRIEKEQSRLAAELEKKYLYLNTKTRAKVLNEYQTKFFNVGPRGKNRLRVQATAYTSHRSQTDNSPFVAAWGDRIGPGMKAIAVSRDLLGRNGLRYRQRVSIEGLPGTYLVIDKMNPRLSRHIDIYMGIDRGKALRWGRRSVNIYW